MVHQLTICSDIRHRQGSGRLLQEASGGTHQVTLDTGDGRQVGLLKDGWCGEGEHVVLLPNHLSSGTYHLRSEQNSSVCMQWLIIVR